MLLIAGAFRRAHSQHRYHGLFKHSQQHLVASPALSSSRQPRFPLLMKSLHPIRRQYTPSDRVHRNVTGAAQRKQRTTSQRMKHHATGGSPPLGFRTPTTTVEILPCENADLGRHRPRLEVPRALQPGRYASTFTKVLVTARHTPDREDSTPSDRVESSR